MNKQLIKFSSMIAVVFAVFSMLFVSCTEEEDDVNTDPVNNEEPTVEEPVAPKYVFFLIGDGMSNPQINLAEAALANEDFVIDQEKSTGEIVLGELSMTSDFDMTGMQTTHAEDRYITGSAASATAMACGEKTTTGTNYLYVR